MTGRATAFPETKEGRWRVTFNPQGGSGGLRDTVIAYIRKGRDSLHHSGRLGSSNNAEVWHFTVNGRGFVCKEYLRRNPFEYLKAAVAGSRAKRAWDQGLLLMAKGIGTPAVQAYGEKCFLSIPTRNFLITDFLPQASGIYTFFRSFPSDSGRAEGMMRKRDIIRSLGSFVGEIHAAGIFHGDLRLDNILISVSPDSSPVFSLIDNERNRFFPGGIPSKFRQKNLTQLNMVVLPCITSTDRLRFFGAYLEKNPGLGPESRKWFREIFISTRRRLGKKFPGIWERPR